MHGELINNRKSYALKIMFFLLLISFSMLMYLESRMITDIIYCGLVSILFIKFLTIKLYH